MKYVSSINSKSRSKNYSSVLISNSLTSSKFKSSSEFKLRCKASALLKSISLIIALVFLPSLSFANNNSASLKSESIAANECTVASDLLVSKISSGIVSPVIVTAADLITKVYGAINPTSKNETILQTGKTLNLRPEVDETGMWLDSDAGYCVSYSGMTPQVSAVAQFDDETLSSFGYFFIFPYASGCREEANRSQCAFCSSLLQEMFDMGSIVGIPVDDEENPDPLFSALGSYEGNHINVSLSEQTTPDASGRFLLVLEVTPDVYNLYDAVMAME